MSTEKRIRYGHVEGRGRGREMSIKAGSYFHRRGGHFAYGASANICGSSNFPEYWVETPKDTSGANSWLSVHGDKCYCIWGNEDLFEIPVCEAGASLAASQIGLLNHLINADAACVNEGAAVTATSVQCLYVSNVLATDFGNALVEIVDVDTEQSGSRVATVRMTQKQYFAS